jgi:hypothetical protein
LMSEWVGESPIFALASGAKQSIGAPWIASLCSQ